MVSGIREFILFYLRPIWVTFLPSPPLPSNSSTLKVLTHPRLVPRFRKLLASVLTRAGDTAPIGKQSDDLVTRVDVDF